MDDVTNEEKVTIAASVEVGKGGKGVAFPGEPEMLADERFIFGDPKDPRTAQGIFELPRGIPYDGDVLHVIQMREMTGKEEDVLMSTGPFIKRLNIVFREIVERIGDVTDKARIGTLVKKASVLDRGAMMIMMRRMTHGDVMPMREVPCQHCKKKQNVLAHLETVDVTMPTSPDVWEHETVCEKSGMVIPWAVFTGDREEILSRVTDAVGGTSDMLTWAILIRAKRIGDVEIELTDKMFTGDGKLRMDRKLHAIIQAAKNMTASDRNQLRKDFRAKEGALNLQVQFTCENPMCEQTSTVEIDIASPDFLFPGEIR